MILLLLGFIASSSQAEMTASPGGWDCAITQISVCARGVCSPVKGSGTVHFDGAFYSRCQPADRCTTIEAGLIAGEDFLIITTKDISMAEVRADMSFLELREVPAGLLVSRGGCHEAGPRLQPAPLP